MCIVDILGTLNVINPNAFRNSALWTSWAFGNVRNPGRPERIPAGRKKYRAAGKKPAGRKRIPAGRKRIPAGRNLSRKLRPAGIFPEEFRPAGFPENQKPEHLPEINNVDFLGIFDVESPNAFQKCGFSEFLGFLNVESIDIPSNGIITLPLGTFTSENPNIIQN